MGTIWKNPKGRNFENYTAPKRYNSIKSGQCMICGKSYTITDRSRLCPSCKDFIVIQKRKEHDNYRKVK